MSELSLVVYVQYIVSVVILVSVYLKLACSILTSILLMILFITYPEHKNSNTL